MTELSFPGVGFKFVCARLQIVTLSVDDMMKRVHVGHLEE